MKFFTLICSSFFLALLQPTWSNAADRVDSILVMPNLQNRVDEIGPALKERTVLDDHLVRGVSVGDRLVINTGKGSHHILTITSENRSELGNSIITGITSSGGRGLLVVAPDGYVRGDISGNGQKFLINTDSTGEVYLRKPQIDGIAVPFNTDVSGQMTQSDLIAEVSKARGDPIVSNIHQYRAREQGPLEGNSFPKFHHGPTTIDILVYYDNSLDNPLPYIDYITALGNQAHRNSKTNVTLNVVKAISVAIDSTAVIDAVLDNLRRTESPFDNRSEDEATYGADITIAVRDTLLPEDQKCGLANMAVTSNSHYRNLAVGVVTKWDIEQSGSYYCPDRTFAHEIGHVLGADHDRSDTTAAGAHSYSHGYNQLGVFDTVMSVVGDPDIHRFSNPNISCAGYPCGVIAGEPAAADNARTFRATAPLVAGHEGGQFEPDTIGQDQWVFEGDCGQELEEGSPLGEYRFHWFLNNSGYDIQLIGHGSKQPSGVLSEYDLSNVDLIPARGGVYYLWACSFPNEEKFFGDIFEELWWSYSDPVTGEVVETGRTRWDAEIQRDYIQVRVAYGYGGSFSDNPERYLAVGETSEFEFTPDSGYSLTEIDTTCEGERQGDSFMVTATSDNCRIGATFRNQAFAFSVTPSVVGAGGSISPNSKLDVEVDTRTPFDLIPEAGFQVASVGGTCGGSLSGLVFHTDPVIADCSVEAKFKPVAAVVTATADTGGTISPTSREVEYGDTTTFTLAPDAGYRIQKVIGSCGGSIYGETFYTQSIIENCTVEAVFEEIPIYTVTVTTSDGGSAYHHGDGEQIIEEISCDSSGSYQTFDFTAAEGSINTIALCQDSGYRNSSVSGTCNVYWSGGGSNPPTKKTKELFAGPIEEDCTIDIEFKQDASEGGQDRFLQFFNWIWSGRPGT